MFGIRRDKGGLIGHKLMLSGAGGVPINHALGAALWLAFLLLPGPLHLEGLVFLFFLFLNFSPGYQVLGAVTCTAFLRLAVDALLGPDSPIQWVLLAL